MRQLAFFLASAILGGFKELLRKTRRIRVFRERNKEIALNAKIRENTGLVIICNHPSLFETLAVPSLLWPRFLVRPSLVPISTPDEKNFMDAGLFGKIFKALVRLFMRIVPTVPIPRDNARKSGEAILTLVKKIDNGNTCLFFAEGGRTGKETDVEKLRIRGKRRIRKFQDGIAFIVKKTKRPFIVLPLWVDGAEEILPVGRKVPHLWKQMKISFGRPFMVDKKLKEKKKEELLAYLEDQVLAA
jgi:1-acyl-sn-glycerol-3-phosphate acyltransferase